MTTTTTTSPKPPKGPKMADVRYEAARARRAATLENVEAGMSITQAWSEAGMSAYSYAKARSIHPDWAAQIDVVINGGHRLKNYNGTHADFFNQYFGHKLSWFQLLYMEELAKMPPGNILVAIFPPEHGKTTMFEDYVNMKLALDPNHRFVIAAANQLLARKMLGRIKNRMEPMGPTRSYVRDFGPFEPQTGTGRNLAQPWGADYFNVWRKSQSDERDYCVDETTEILTEHGWRTHDQIRPGMRVVTLDHTTGLGCWQPLLAVHRHEARLRRMLSFEGRCQSSLTTEGHRWPVERSRPEHGLWVREWTTSEELHGGHRITRSAPMIDLPTEPKWSDALVELAAWYWTEGNVNKGRRAIYQSPGVNPGHHARIRRCCTELFGPAGKVRGGSACWNEYDFPGRDMTAFNLWREAAAVLDHVAPNKMVAPWFICDLTLAQLHLFINTSIDGDGHARSNQTVIAQRNPRHLDAMSMACALAGIATATSPSSGDMTSMTLLRTTHFAPVQSGRRVGKAKTEWVQHHGMVWCPQTENGTWLARRNGNVFFTGNSVNALGVNSEIIGSRCEHLHVDDPQSTKTLGRKKGRKPETVKTDEIAAWFHQDALSRPGEHGITTISGTRIGKGDFLSYLMRQKEMIDQGIMKIIKFPVIVKNPTTGKPMPLWPERYTLESLERMRVKAGDADYTSWDTQYMMNPEAADATQQRTFTGLVDQCLNGDLSFDDRPTAGSACYVMVDPALGGHNVTMVVELVAGVPPKLPRMILRYVSDVEGLRNNESIFDEIEKAVSWAESGGARVTDCVIEAMNFQAGLARDTRLREMSYHYGFALREHFTRSNKGDAEVGVPGMARLFMRRQIDIPYKDDARYGGRTREIADEFRKQLNMWEPGVRGTELVQDQVMAMWFGFALWESRWRSSYVPDGHGAVTPDVWKRTGLTYAPSLESALVVPDSWRF